MNKKNKPSADNGDVAEVVVCNDKSDSIGKEFNKSPGNALPEVQASQCAPLEKEINGPKGLEPTRYGDWESKGRCYDF